MMEKDFGLTREGIMACSTCGGGTKTYGGRAGTPMPTEGAVMLEYTGSKAGGISFRGARSGKDYRFSASHPHGYVLQDDVSGFLARSDFRVAQSATPDLRTAQTAEPMIVASRAPGFSSPAPVSVASDPLAAVLATDPVAAVLAPAVPTAVAVAEGQTDADGETLPVVGSTGAVKTLLDTYPTRTALNAEAKRLGVANPEGLPNKTAVANAIVVLREVRGG